MPDHLKRHLRPDAVLKNAGRLAEYLRELAGVAQTVEDNMGLISQWPAIKAELLSLRAEKATLTKANADLTAEVAKYAALDAEADQLEAGATAPAAPATVAPATTGNPIDQL